MIRANKRIVSFICLFAGLCFAVLRWSRNSPIGLVLLLGVGILVVIVLYPTAKKTKPTRAEEKRARKDERRWQKEQRIRGSWRRPWR